MDAAKWAKIQATCIEIGFIQTAEPVEKFLAPDSIQAANTTPTGRN
jgi:hypothetical protein